MVNSCTIWLIPLEKADRIFVKIVITDASLDEEVPTKYRKSPGSGRGIRIRIRIGRGMRCPSALVCNEYAPANFRANFGPLLTYYFPVRL